MEILLPQGDSMFRAVVAGAAKGRISGGGRRYHGYVWYPPRRRYSAGGARGRRQVNTSACNMASKISQIQPPTAYKFGRAVSEPTVKSKRFTQPTADRLISDRADHEPVCSGSGHLFKATRLGSAWYVKHTQC